MPIEIKEQAWGMHDAVKCVILGAPPRDGVCYPDVSSCLTLTVVRYGPPHTIVGAHLGLMDRNLADPSGKKDVAIAAGTLNSLLEYMGNLVPRDPNLRRRCGHAAFIIGWLSFWDPGNVTAIQNRLRLMVRPGGTVHERNVDDLVSGQENSCVIEFQAGGGISVQMKAGGVPSGRPHYGRWTLPAQLP
jgi:hypothetical protein